MVANGQTFLLFIKPLYMCDDLFAKNISWMGTWKTLERIQSTFTARTAVLRLILLGSLGCLVFASSRVPCHKSWRFRGGTISARPQRIDKLTANRLPRAVRPHVIVSNGRSEREQSIRSAVGRWDQVDPSDHNYYYCCGYMLVGISVALHVFDLI